MPKIKISEVVRLYPVSDGTVRNYIKQGLLPAYRVGTKIIRIDTEDLDALFRPVVTESKPLTVTDAQHFRGDAA